MSRACAYAVAPVGLDGRIVEVEAHTGPGLPRTILVGLGLDGWVRPVRGVVLATLAAAQAQKNAGRMSVEIFIRAPHFDFQQGGTTRLPARVMIKVDTTRERWIVDIIKR